MKTLADIFAWLDISGCKGRNFSMEKYPIGYSWIRNELKDSDMTDDLYVGLLSVAITELAKGFEASTEDKRSETLAVIKEGYFSYRHKIYCQTELAAAIAAAKAEKERAEQEAIALAERKKAERAEKLAQLTAFIDAGANRETAGGIIFGSEWPDVRASLPDPEPTKPEPTKPEPTKPASKPAPRTKR
jgi:hypothetical protein